MIRLFFDQTKKKKPAVAAKAKNKVLSFLPKKSKAAVFMRSKFRSRAENKNKNHPNGGYPEPIPLAILEEARKESFNSRFDQTKEPTSPRISCMGQIKHKKKIDNVQETKTMIMTIPMDHAAKPFSFHPHESLEKPLLELEDQIHKTPEISRKRDD